MLSIRNLSFSYGAIRTLREIDMTMQTGRITCVMGRNGVGKTTLLKNVMGLLRPSAGKIHLESQDITSFSPNRRARTGLALVPQGRQIFPKLTVEENLRVGMQAAGGGKNAIPEEVFETFPILKDITKRMGGDLSGGQQQQLAIARALVSKPKVLLLDEPTEGIQPSTIKQIGHVLRKLADDENITVVLVEQYLAFVCEFGHEFYIMSRGRAVAEGKTSDLSDALIESHLSV